MNAADFDAFIRDQGIERSDRVSSYLLFEADAALKSGRAEEALNLGKMASQISPESPIPSFFLAKAAWQTSAIDVLNILAHYINGMRLVFGDFLFILPVLSSFLLFFLLAILLSVLAFIVYSLCAFLPLWAHQISEVSKGYLHPFPAGLLFSVFLFMPLLLGLPPLWFILFALALFWGFYNRIEKGIVFAFIFGVGVTPWILPFVLTIFTANGSLLLDEMSRNYHSDYSWTPSPVELDQSGWEGWFIRASYATQSGDYIKANAFYQQALEENPDSSMILNNLGNLAFYTKDYEKALIYYHNAVKAEPSLVSAHYNMSQAYREMLLFKEGEAVFAEAVEISTETTENYAMQSARYPNFPVIEERFTKADLVRKLFTKTRDSIQFSERLWQGVIGQIALTKAPLVAAFWGVVLWLSGIFHKSFISGKQCAFCKKPICGRCERRLFSYEVCRPCEMRFISVRRKSDFEIIEDAVKRIPARLYPLFIIPGGGHLAIKWTKAGIFFLSIFFLLLSVMFMGDILGPPTEWYLHRSRSVLPIVLILMLYLVTCADLVIKRSRRQWL